VWLHNLLIGCCGLSHFLGITVFGHRTVVPCGCS
jgi:hypothetical protein